jgi:hypothetical protein
MEKSHIMAITVYSILVKLNNKFLIFIIRKKELIILIGIIVYFKIEFLHSFKQLAEKKT